MAGFPNAQDNPAGAIPVYIASPTAATSADSSNIVGVGGTLIKDSPGVLAQIIITVAATLTGTLVAYDGQDDTGTVLTTIDATKVGAYPFNIKFTSGLFVVSDSDTVNAVVSYF